MNGSFVNVADVFLQASSSARSRAPRVLLTYIWGDCGDVTSSFITPHSQLSADGEMEVVTWGPAGGYGFHSVVCDTGGGYRCHRPLKPVQTPTQHPPPPPNHPTLSPDWGMPLPGRLSG